MQNLGWVYFEFETSIIIFFFYKRAKLLLDKAYVFKKFTSFCNKRLHFYFTGLPQIFGFSHKKIKTLNTSTIHVQNTAQFLITGPLILPQNAFRFIINVTTWPRFYAVIVLNASDKPTLRKKLLPVVIQNICTIVFTLHYITHHHSKLEKSLLLNCLDKVSLFRRTIRNLSCRPM